MLAGITVQGCQRADSVGASQIVPTSPKIETTQQANTQSDIGSSSEASSSEMVPVSIIIDGEENPSATSTASAKPSLTVYFDAPIASPIEQATQSTEMPSQNVEAMPLQPETIKDIVKKIEKGTPDDEIIEDGRTVQMYSTPLKNGMSLILAKETIQKNWNEDQSNVVFYDRGTEYVAYNTVQFARRYIDGNAAELRFGKGRSSAIIRNAYMTPDPSQVSVLLTSRHLDDSLDYLARNKTISLYQQSEGTDPVTLQRVINSGGRVLDTTGFLREWEWLLDQEQGNYVYSIGRQSDGRFKRESVGDPVEINPSSNIK